MADEGRRQGVSDDTRALMAFQSRSKSVGVAYLLWFFLGGFGGHRFYLGNIGIAVLILACTLIGFGVLVTLIVTAAILIYDLFTIPSQVRRYNERLMTEIGG
ncbi:TM2 domain-containing protein [Roseicitreum antarcticum]|uniref:TM2 domain-containing membrane protein YozV n=1 Tax=Roseicitreum antarcticum TaxID=564137 RepID=A0A1H2ZTE5_9RHOB|nr:TM2 domain-containing protein [Roseicitreum antarcticum]SDX20174.1 TM2 domain-containing membrane protein YozV [Roseicitreum antarcticum]